MCVLLACCNVTFHFQLYYVFQLIKSSKPVITLLLPYRLPSTSCLDFIGVVYFCFKRQENIYGNEEKMFSGSLTHKGTVY